MIQFSVVNLGTVGVAIVDGWVSAHFKYFAYFFSIFGVTTYFGNQTNRVWFPFFGQLVPVWLSLFADFAPAVLLLFVGKMLGENRNYALFVFFPNEWQTVLYDVKNIFKRKIIIAPLRDKSYHNGFISCKIAKVPFVKLQACSTLWYSWCESNEEQKACTRIRKERLHFFQLYWVLSIEDLFWPLLQGEVVYDKIFFVDYFISCFVS